MNARKTARNRWPKTGRAMVTGGRRQVTVEPRRRGPRKSPVNLCEHFRPFSGLGACGECRVD